MTYRKTETPGFTDTAVRKQPIGNLGLIQRVCDRLVGWTQVHSVSDWSIKQQMSIKFCVSSTRVPSQPPHPLLNPLQT